MLALIFRHRRRSRRLSAAAVFMAAACAWLAAAPSAAGQWLEEPRLSNFEEIAREVAARTPPALRGGGVVGEVHLRLRVLADSAVDSASITVLEASRPELAEPAAAIARRLRFVPATSEGRAVPVWFRYSLSFNPGSWRSAPSPAPADEGTYEAVEEKPRLRNGRDVAREISARYPPALKEAGVKGDVVMRFKVLPNGTVDPATISADLATDPAFEEAAAGAVRLMRFEPAKLNNRAVPVWIAIPIRFEVETPSPAAGDSAGKARGGETPGL